MLALCKEQVSKTAMKDIFVLTYDRMRRYEGAWHMEQKVLFPSYIILESNDGVLLEEEIRNRSLLGPGREFSPISQDEENFLRRICGKKYHLKMSKGVIRQGVTTITDGPLRGMERLIDKIDRHKRMVRLRTPKGENIRYLPAGLEIVEKS